MIKFIKEKIFKIKPIFKIKIEKSWFSDNWYAIKFSNNNGYSWQYLIRAENNYNYPYDRLKIEVRYERYDSLKNFVKQFSTYEDCIAFNENVRNTVKKFNEESYKKYAGARNESDNFINEFNKTH